MGSTVLRAAAIAAVTITLAGLSGCSRDEPEDAPAADAPGAAGAGAAPAAGVAAGGQDGSRWMYLCTTDVPAPAPNCTTERNPTDPPGLAVVHTCPSRANPPPQGCQEAESPPLVGGGPGCPGPGCPTTPTRE